MTHHKNDTVTTPCIDHGLKGDRAGYGTKAYVIDGVRGKTSSHRWAYVEHHQMELSSIKGAVVRHRCDNPRCIRPDHLELGTQKQNCADTVRRGRFNASKLSDAVFSEVFQRLQCPRAVAAELGLDVSGVERRIVRHRRTAALMRLA